MKPFEVMVIGGGAVGNSVLYHLSQFVNSIGLLEREPDVCEGTSKTNSAIAHTGFDAKPGTLESQLLAESRAMWPEIVGRLKVPFLPCGALMVAVTDEEWHTVQTEVMAKAHENGVDDVQLLSREDVLSALPGVSSETRGGLLIPGESLLDPFWLTRSYAEAAILNGAQVFTDAEVSCIERRAEAECYCITTADGREFKTKRIVNAAGLWSDEIARLVGDLSFTITPRRGQFILTEDELELPHIVLPVPNKISKGILVAPIVFGGYLLGPTAEETTDKRDRSTTVDGLNTVIEGTKKLLPRTRNVTSIRQFAGLRAVSSTGDFIVRFSDTAPDFFHVAGIRSTGISVSPALGQFAARQLADEYGWSTREDWQPSLPEQFLADEPSEEIVCLCRTITRGEIDNALASPLPPRTVDGVKRRTGACLGDCQGNLCMPKIIRILSEHHQVPYSSVEKHMSGSHLTVPSDTSVIEEELVHE